MPKVKKKLKKAKLWLLLVGVGEYLDRELKSLPYAVADCKGLYDVLKKATKFFPETEISIYYSQSNTPPKLANVNHKLDTIIKLAKSEDTILFYFSGHGKLESTTKEVFLCLEDTITTSDKITTTGLKVTEILDKIANCQANQQLIILDACHSGGLSIRNSKNIPTIVEAKNIRNKIISPSNLSSELVKILERRSSYSQGFYGLLSCDANQLSWEFPELGHGLFSYYLIRGLQGYAADSEGVIEVKSLYKYIYHSTLQYIDKFNQQVRLINQQKSRRGETKLQAENPIQTPKLIVEAVGELILGLKDTESSHISLRQALVIESSGQGKTTQEISKLLGTIGGFNLEYWHPQQKNLPDIKLSIQKCLKSYSDGVSNNLSLNKNGENTVALLYIRGKIEETETGESLLNLATGIKISRSWLRQQIKNSTVAQQIIIIDCFGQESLQSWLDEFNLETLETNSEIKPGQCLIAGIAAQDTPEIFAKTLLTTLKQSNYSMGFSASTWITQIKQQLPRNVWHDFYLSGIRGVIEVIPSQGVSRNSNNVDFGICPYRGLQAFREQDQDYFWGRKALTQTLINAIKHHSFIPIIGASGSGKSSLVQAGLMVELRRGNYIPGSDTWWLKIFRPGYNPLQSLALTLADQESEIANKNQQLEIEGLLHIGGEGFVRWLRQRPEPMIVLVIDQFEELFTLASAKETQKLLDLLIEALEYAKDKFKLVITLRADFIDACLAIPKLNDLLQKFSILVTPKFSNINDYRDAIIKPAQAVGLAVEAELVEVLLAELEQATNDLPLLQFVLEQLWEYREQGILTLQSYQQKIGGIKTALEKKAEATYQSLDTGSQEVAQWIFLQLTQLGEGIEDTRRRVTKTELLSGKYNSKLVASVLNILTEAKLLVVNQESKTITTAKSRSVDHNEASEINILKAETTVEIAHEILIHHWSTLRWWLQENRHILQKQRQIEQWAKQWLKKAKHQDFLLQGIKLIEAEIIYQQYPESFNTLEIAYIKASKKARNIRRLKQAAIGTSIVAVLGFLGGFSWLKQQQAQRLELIRLATADAITPENSQIIANILPDYLKITQQNRQQAKLDAAKADYRQIIAVANKLKAVTKPDSVTNKEEIETILTTATNSLGDIIRQQMLPQLEIELQKNNYGKIIATDFSLKEAQFTGALKVTYSILLSKNGIHSDRNNDGYLTEGEELLIPCTTIADIEQMWRKATENRCGWYGEANIYESLACMELGGKTLTQKLFFPPSIPLLARDWQQRCKFSQDK